METAEQISARMKKQKAKKTKAEVLLAKALWHRGCLLYTSDPADERRFV